MLLVRATHRPISSPVFKRGLHIAVLGGGVTGLAVTHYLDSLLAAKKVKAEISIIESSSRLGGWVHSELTRPSSASGHEADYLLEYGPRTLRPSGVRGATTLQLIHELGLESEVLHVPKSSPAAQSRFLYYNGSLIELPRSPLTLFKSSSISKDIALGVLREPFVPKSTKEDESIDEFFTRRFGPKVAQNLVSAVVHGIFAGDSQSLSVRSCFPSLWNAEQKHGSVVKGMLMNKTEKPDLTPETQAFVDTFKDTSIYSFRNGLQTLVDRLSSRLRQSSNVKIHLNSTCKDLKISSDSKVSASIIGPRGTESTITPDLVISTLPAHTLSSLTAKSSKSIASLLTEIPTVDVGVVNLAYSRPVLPMKGFGYLVPRTQESQILGCIFDSVAVNGQPSGVNNQGERLTVMMGGWRYKELFMGKNESELTMIAMENIKKHLGITDSPIVTRAHIARKCIPQYQVGHWKIMQDLHDAIQTETKGTLMVAGAAYGGVGINDVIFQANNVAKNVAERIVHKSGFGGLTGLETVVH